MSVSKASVITLTFGRYELAKKVFEHNFKNAWLDYELLICDQGMGITDDERAQNKDEHLAFQNYLKSLRPDYLRLNNYNEGVARSLNQLMLRCKTDYIVFMPPDILLPPGWLKEIVNYASDIPTSGIVGFAGQDLILPPCEVAGISGKKYKIACQQEMVLDGCQVFGASLVTRELINTIGYYCEEYHPYGLEDSDYCFRAKMAQFLVYYLPHLTSEHIGLDHDEKTAYKEAKVRSYFSNAGHHRWRLHNYWRVGLYVPPPILKNQLI
jgi:GT2 family glycosyltransferase